MAEDDVTSELCMMLCKLSNSAQRAAELESCLQRAMAVITAAVHLCNDQAAYDRHALLFSLNQALIDNGFKVP